MSMIPLKCLLNSVFDTVACTKLTKTSNYFFDIHHSANLVRLLCYIDHPAASLSNHATILLHATKHLV